MKVESKSWKLLVVLPTLLLVGVALNACSSSNSPSSTSSSGSSTTSNQSTGQQAGTLTFSGSLSGTANLKSSEINCSFPPTDISLNPVLDGKGWSVDIDYSIAKPGATTNLQSDGSNTSGDAVLVASPEGITEWVSTPPGTTGTITLDASKGGSIDATLEGTGTASGGQAEHVSGSWTCAS